MKHKYIYITLAFLILLVVGSIGLLVVGSIGGYYYGPNQAKSNNTQIKGHKPITRLAKEQHVTKVLEAKAATNKDLKIYNNQTDLSLIKSKLDVDEYDDITLLMYSDGCPNCNNHVKDLAERANKMAKPKHLVLAVPNGRDNQRLHKYFYVPDYFPYPTILYYDGQIIKGDGAHGQLMLTRSQSLYR